MTADNEPLRGLHLLFAVIEGAAIVVAAGMTLPLPLFTVVTCTLFCTPVFGLDELELLETEALDDTDLLTEDVPVVGVVFCLLLVLVPLDTEAILLPVKLFELLLEELFPFVPPGKDITDLLALDVDDDETTLFDIVLDDEENLLDVLFDAVVTLLVTDPLCEEDGILLLVPWLAEEEFTLGIGGKDAILLALVLRNDKTDAAVIAEEVVEL